MPKFSEWADEVDADEVWEGSFECQTCGEDVVQANMNVPERLLSWRCSKGHYSLIKDFPL